ncbi:ATP-dependent RNA helicase, partial [Vibrio vulnificus]
LLDSAVEQRGAVRDELCRRLGCDAETLAAALLARLTAGKALDLESVRREQPLTPSAPRERADRGERGERPERSGERRPMAPPSEGRARCRTALGARDGVAAKNLLGAVLNEGG